MKIDAILFDADGVVQRPLAARRDAWVELLGSGRDVDKFVAAIFEVEELALEGQVDFIEGLSSIWAEWGCHRTLDDALAAWTMIEMDAEIAEIVRSLRLEYMIAAKYISRVTTAASKCLRSPPTPHGRHCRSN